MITALWPQESGRFIHSCFPRSLIINQHVPGTKKVRTQFILKPLPTCFWGELSNLPWSFRDFRSQLLEINGWSPKSLKSIPSGSGPRVGGEGRQGRICKELQVFLMWSMYGDGIWLQAHFLIRKKNQVVGILFGVCERRGMCSWMMLDGWVI